MVARRKPSFQEKQFSPRSHWTAWPATCYWWFRIL